MLRPHQMHTPTIYDDASKRPDLFLWFGDNGANFEKWLAALSLRVHPGLVDFWRRTGGGDIFETETLLGPLAADESDNVLKMSKYHWGKGLPNGLLIFHVGVCVSASYADPKRHRVCLVTLDPGSYRTTGSFNTFDDWYQRAMRSEFASRYGL